MFCFQANPRDITDAWLQDPKFEDGRPKVRISNAEKKLSRHQHPVLILEAPAPGSDKDQIVQFLPFSHNFREAEYPDGTVFGKNMEYGIEGRGMNKKSRIYLSEPKTTRFGNIHLYVPVGNGRNGNGHRISEPGFNKLIENVRKNSQASEAGDRHSGGPIAGPSGL